ncbi:hypothetical protein [Streptomyces sp. NPDC059378]|uniref:hypothetical protein n=1 Tax=Streptomyces sp. NPDC059378 TaxID=3346815 RepID=UPI0036BB8362
MITASDEGPDFDPDDPLAVILRPAPEYLGPPPGRYEAIRRSAGRRRLLRAAAGFGLTCAAAVLVALPLHPSTPEAPVSPVVPLAPPPAGSPSAAPEVTASPAPVTPHASPTARDGTSARPTTRDIPTRPRSAVPSASSAGR